MFDEIMYREKLRTIMKKEIWGKAEIARQLEVSYMTAGKVVDLFNKIPLQNKTLRKLRTLVDEYEVKHGKLL